MQDALIIRGSPGSPYTRKMLAVLRCRHIAYRYVQNAQDVAHLPAPRVGLIPVLYIADEHGELQPEVDSTPIIRRLEDEYPGRNIIPSDPVLGLLDALFEDYGDEWLTKAMFHYRWYYPADIDMAGRVLPHYADVSVADAQISEMTRVFAERQIGRLYVVGSNDITAPVIEASYKRFLGLLNEHLKAFPFLLGRRPGSGDFGCFGQLTQLVQFDPTPAAVAAADFPRVHAWVSKMEDLSGIEMAEDAYVTAEALPQTLTDLLTEIGRTYVPVMLANAEALDKGRDTVATEVEGLPWTQEPFPYQGKCLQWLRIEYARLGAEHQQRFDKLVAGTGCEALFAPPA
ncbi:MAG: glutathione S-transferase N-terminal domain-containing protein [Pseudomonadota bacterium]